MSDEHVMEIGQDFVSGFWSVACLCGWESRQEFGTSAEATDAWDDHCDVVFMEATGG